jgi:hypothetical protein
MEKLIITTHQFILLDRPYFYLETELLRGTRSRLEELLYEKTGLGLIEDAILKLDRMTEIDEINKELVQRN